MRKLSDQTRAKIIKRHLEGFNQVEISDYLGISQWSVSTTLAKWKHSRCPFNADDFRSGNVKYCPYCGVKLKKEED